MKHLVNNKGIWDVCEFERSIMHHFMLTIANITYAKPFQTLHQHLFVSCQRHLDTKCKISVDPLTFQY